MCGNFGLLALAAAPVEYSAENTMHSRNNNNSSHVEGFHKPKPATDELDISLNESMHQVSRLEGLRVLESVSPQVPRAQQDLNKPTPSSMMVPQENMLSVLKILEAQTACTEIRGGQAGGYSSIEYKYKQADYQSRFEAVFGSQMIAVPHNVRVRMVARKRHPLAADLSSLYLRQRGGRLPDPSSTITGDSHN